MTSKAAQDVLNKVHGVYAKERINYLLKQFNTYRAGFGDSVDNTAAALEILQIQIADIKPEFEPYDTLMAIAVMSAAKDPAFDTT